MTDSRAIDALVPQGVRAVCERLQARGHRAVAVGGAVRDALMGREPGDWDVATSATPDDVMATFARTIPTGVKHGTVTVLVGKHRLPVEVTTFRGEGGYTDGRHPDYVTFGVSLEEDLSRRDFVINAIAYDPVVRALIDPFGGREDIRERRVRAVGDPAQRFAEDGLRVMRAVRFAAVLDFELDPATEAAIPGALPVLDRVSRERVRDEFFKTLAAPAPSRGLSMARRTGVLHAVLPELAFRPGEAEAGAQKSDPEGVRWRRALARVDAAGDVLIRLAALLIAAPAKLPSIKRGTHPLRRLKLSNAQLDRVDRLLRYHALWAQEVSDAELRARLGELGRDHVADLLALWRAERRARDAPAVARIDENTQRVQRIIAAGDALTVADLALSGGDVMRILNIPPGRHIGELLSKLLERVHQDPALNRADALEPLLRELHASHR